MAREEKVEKIDPPIGEAGEVHLQVSVKEPPIAGRANMAIIKAVAGHLGVAPSRVRIISGFTSKQKILEIN